MRDQISQKNLNETPPVAYVGQIVPAQSSVTNDLKSNSILAKLGRLVGFFIVFLIFGGIAYFIGRVLDWKWLCYVGPAFFGLLWLGMSKENLKSTHAPCPYCGKNVGGGDLQTLTLDDKKKQCSCSHCYEWLISDGGRIRAFREEDITKETEFTCPITKDCRWPNECIVCGAPPTQFKQARSINLNASKLLVGLVSLSDSIVKNIPYCAVHENAVAVKKGGEGDILLVFKDYMAQRRFLHFNKKPSLADKQPGSPQST